MASAREQIEETLCIDAKLLHEEFMHAIIRRGDAEHALWNAHHRGNQQDIQRAATLLKLAKELVEDTRTAYRRAEGFEE